MSIYVDISDANHPMPTLNQAGPAKEEVDQAELLELVSRNVPEDVRSAIDLAIECFVPTDFQCTVVTSTTGASDAWPS